MKIIQINSVYKNGSTGRIVESLHNFYLDNGNESFVVYGRGKTKIDDENVFKCSSELASKINAFRARITGLLYGGNFLATKKAIKIVKKINPDFVHIHNMNDNYINVYKFLAFLAKNEIKTIITLHSEQTYTGTCGYALGCEKWANIGCSKCPHLYLSTKSKLDNTKKAFYKIKSVISLFKKSKLTIVGCTPWLTKRAQKSIILSGFNCLTIINGSSVDDFTILKNVKKEQKNVLFVNPRIDDPVKGHQFLNDLVKKLPDYKFTVIGPYTAKTQKVNNVIYTGSITSKEKLVEYYNKASVSIMMSENECFPMTIIESLLCGTKMCLFKCYGPDECYDDECVKFCDYGNVEQLAENIKEIVAYPSERIRNYAVKFLSKERMGFDYLNLFKHL